MNTYFGEPMPDSPVSQVDPDSLIKSKGRSSRRNVTIEWKNIHYKVPLKDSPGETKEILKNLSGNAQPGEVLGIMGTSGAGKSTLLDILAARLVSNDVSGSILLNGQGINRQQFRRESGYVKQSDALFPMLTVKETLQFAAYLRIPDKTMEEKRQIAEKTINTLRLESCADTIVGDEANRGISGGQKRRVSIGIDIIHDPKVIFLDEPTSGLDSNTALSIMETLIDLAKSNSSTVVVTIHQPSARIFNMINKIMFLCDGRMTYFGASQNLQSNIVSIYNELGLGVPPYANPPEIFLDLSDELFASDKLSALTSKCEGSNGEDTSISANFDTDGEDMSYANSLFGDIYILSLRASTNIIRTKELFFARLGSTIGFAVQVSTLFLFAYKDKTLNGFRYSAAYFIFAVAFFLWTSLEALPIFFNEREIFQREYSSGAYRASAYTISSTIVFWPYLLIISVVYACIGWWIIGLPNYAGIFFFFIFVVFATLLAGNTFATMISTLVPNPMMGQTAGSALFSVMFLFSGFFISRSEIPPYWIWLHYMSLFKYAFDSMIVNAFKGDKSLNFSGAEIMVDGVYTVTNEEVLNIFGVSNTNRWTGLGILFGWVIFYRLVFYYRLITAFNGSRK